VANAARTIDVGALQRRLPIRGAKDELDEVALAFNDTLAHLEHAVGEMRQFSTALAHELRTPQTALRGEIEIAVREGGLDAEASPVLASQLEEIDKLKRLIDQILTLARAEAGQIALARDQVDVGQLAQRVVDQLELVAQDKSVELRCEVADTVHVKGDEQWLTRLLLNLLDNALKFTAAGGSVIVRVSREPWWALLSVRDSGVGIDADALPHLFERFFRADPARSPSTQGAGLGLSLVKWIVEQHHGRIDVDSEPGRGTTFIVRLPAH
jgi:heavy metal sensor kinase